MSAKWTLDEVILEFKRKGHFDSLRNTLSSECGQDEMEHEFFSYVEQAADQFFRDHGPEAFTLENKYTVQSQILQIIERKSAPFDSLKQQLEKKVLQHEESISQIIQGIVENEREKVTTVEEEPERVDKEDMDLGQPKKPRINDSLIEDILSFTNVIKKKKTLNEREKEIVSMEVDDTPEPRKTNDQIPVETKMDEKSEEHYSSSSNSSESESEQSSSSSESTSEDEENFMHSNVFLKGQKLAALYNSDETNQEWRVVIVKGFDYKTGKYSCQEANSSRAQNREFSLDELLHFNYNDKNISVGDRVWALLRTKQIGLGTIFMPAKVTQVGQNIIHVQYEDGNTAVVKYNELFSIIVNK